jgi:hypothetical protein
VEEEKWKIIALLAANGKLQHGPHIGNNFAGVIIHKISPLFLYFNTTHTCLSVNNHVTHFNGEAIIGLDYSAALYVTLHNVTSSVVL